MKTVKILSLTAIAALTLTACHHELPADDGDRPDADPPVQAIQDEVPVDPNQQVGAPEDMVPTGEAPIYTAYSEAQFATLAGSEPFAIFFHAEWCPTCRQMEKYINADLSLFPVGTKILKANYDTETALKAKYGITVQSTVVIIDGNGEYVQTLAAPSEGQLKSALTEVLS